MPRKSHLQILDLAHFIQDINKQSTLVLLQEWSRDCSTLEKKYTRPQKTTTEKLFAKETAVKELAQQLEDLTQDLTQDNRSAFQNKTLNLLRLLDYLTAHDAMQLSFIPELSNIEEFTAHSKRTQLIFSGHKSRLKILFEKIHAWLRVPIHPMIFILGPQFSLSCQVGYLTFLHNKQVIQKKLGQRYLPFFTPNDMTSIQAILQGLVRELENLTKAVDLPQIKSLVIAINQFLQQAMTWIFRHHPQPFDANNQTYSPNTSMLTATALQIFEVAQQTLLEFFCFLQQFQDFFGQYLEERLSHGTKDDFSKQSALLLQSKQNPLRPWINACIDLEVAYLRENVDEGQQLKFLAIQKLHKQLLFVQQHVIFLGQCPTEQSLRLFHEIGQLLRSNDLHIQALKDDPLLEADSPNKFFSQKAGFFAKTSKERTLYLQVHSWLTTQITHMPCKLTSSSIPAKAEDEVHPEFVFSRSWQMQSRRLIDKQTRVEESIQLERGENPHKTVIKEAMSKLTQQLLELNQEKSLHHIIAQIINIHSSCKKLLDLLPILHNHMSMKKSLHPSRLITIIEQHLQNILGFLHHCFVQLLLNGQVGVKAIYNHLNTDPNLDVLYKSCQQLLQLYSNMLQYAPQIALQLQFIAWLEQNLFELQIYWILFQGPHPEKSRNLQEKMMNFLTEAKTNAEIKSLLGHPLGDTLKKLCHAVLICCEAVATSDLSDITPSLEETPEVVAVGYERDPAQAAARGSREGAEDCVTDGAAAEEEEMEMQMDMDLSSFSISQTIYPLQRQDHFPALPSTILNPASFRHCTLWQPMAPDLSSFYGSPDERRQFSQMEYRVLAERTLS